MTPPALGHSPLREVVTAALRELAGELAEDGTLPGTPAEWELATCKLLVERYGEAELVARAAWLEVLMIADARTAAALAYSGLVAHPHIAVALCEAAR